MSGYGRVQSSAGRDVTMSAQSQPKFDQQAVFADRARLRALIQHDKEAMAAYVQQRTAEADQQRAALRLRERRLTEILTDVPHRPYAIDLGKVRATARAVVFESGGFDIPEPAPQPSTFFPPPLGMFKRIWPGIVHRHQRSLIDAKQNYEQALYQQFSRPAGHEHESGHAERADHYVKRLDPARRTATRWPGFLDAEFRRPGWGRNGV